jgi:hypothetical protein
MLTERQRAVFVKVCKADLKGERYRAEDSGERVTLASLYRSHALLVRWAWRGIEGERDAAYEYAPNPKVRKAVREMLNLPSTETSE